MSRELKTWNFVIRYESYCKTQKYKKHLENYPKPHIEDLYGKCHDPKWKLLSMRDKSPPAGTSRFSCDQNKKSFHMKNVQTHIVPCKYKDIYSEGKANYNSLHIHKRKHRNSMLMKIHLYSIFWKGKGYNDIRDINIMTFLPYVIHFKHCDVEACS